MHSAIRSTGPLGLPFPTPDPFLFCVYHKDLFPPGNERMEAPRRGNGADFDMSAKYRMYHGDRIPGFPQHPHRGFETITATLEGLIDHTDSLGSAGRWVGDLALQRSQVRYGGGDLQWMTAGAGVVHGEMFPLINDRADNTCRLFQIWLNLPARSKMAPPTYRMHWCESIPRIKTPDGLVTVTVWAGRLEIDSHFNHANNQQPPPPTSKGHSGLPPPPDSWAASEGNGVLILHVRLAPGGSYVIPPATQGDSNRMAYWVEGEGLEADGRALASHCSMTLDPEVPLQLRNPQGSDDSEVLLLQGKPIGEPVAQRGPFVMNSQQEIVQAYTDYQRTQFGGWPWQEDAVVFPRDKGRFSLVGGEEERPPPHQA